VCQTGELSHDQVIWKLYLAAEYRGRSLGADLLRHAVASLPEKVDHVDVEHFAGNTAAARFYQRQGFTAMRTDPAPSGSHPAARSFGVGFSCHNAPSCLDPRSHADVRANGQRPWRTSRRIRTMAHMHGMP
jgi:hypothetical protein